MPESLDSADLDALLELEQSPGWVLVVARIQFELERKQRVLENDGDPERVRGAIHTLRLVLSIPEILKDEIKRQLAA